MMKYLLLTLGFLPVLAACHVEDTFYEPPLPRARVEHHHRHYHGGRVYERREFAHRHRGNTIIVRNPPPAQPRVRVERPGTTHRHLPPAQPRVNVEPPAHIRRQLARPVVPGKRIPLKPEFNQGAEKNTHGHD